MIKKLLLWLIALFALQSANAVDAIFLQQESGWHAPAKLSSDNDQSIERGIKNAIELVEISAKTPGQPIATKISSEQQDPQGGNITGRIVETGTMRPLPSILVA